MGGLVYKTGGRKVLAIGLRRGELVYRTEGKELVKRTGGRRG